MNIKFKRITAIILSLLALVSLCACNTQTQESTKDGKLKITATLFAHYDFAKRVAGDLADVTLLLDPGVEVHTYEPSPADIIGIKKSDLFIYTGEYMEQWADSIVKDLDDSTAVLDISDGITLLITANDMTHTHTDHEAHISKYDPHIWTSPANAVIMVQSIADKLCEIDSENSDTYINNAQEYIAELSQLDSDFTEMIQSSQKHKIMFGGRFAMFYFVKHYGLDYSSVYDSCSSEAEPGARLIAQMIDEIKAENIGAVYYEEMSNHTVADRIAAETGTASLLLHTCHNVSREELDNGETYISLMRRNLENLKKGLN